MIFLRHEHFWFCLVQVSTTHFCSFPPAFMSNARPFSDAAPNSPLQDLSNFGSPGSVPDLAPQVQWRTDFRPSSEENFRSSKRISVRWHRFPCSYWNSSDSKTVSWRSHNQWQPSQSRFQVLNKSLAVSQLVSPRWNLVQSQPLAFRDRQALGLYLTEGSTATVFNDPSSSEEDRNTTHRFHKDTSPDDDSARSAVLLRCPFEQCHANMSAWLKKTLAPADMPDKIHCKTGTTSARLVFVTRARCQYCVARFRRWPLLFS